MTKGFNQVRFSEQERINIWNYVLTDHLGSWEKVLDEGRNTVQQTHFDPWGNRMSYTAWDTPQTQVGFPFSRGFTGHEHYDRFKIINANARLYDPVIGRFFSPDPFVQAPDFTQNYNRYSYCLNNPVMYSDPNGEFVIVDSWIVGFVSKLFETSSLKQSWQEANKRAINDVKIWGGLFAMDPNKNFWGKIGEVVSRFTWQVPQTFVGWLVAESCNTLGFGGGVESVDYKYGATVTRTNNSGWGAVTLSSYITGDNSIRADANNSLFQHEYGHYIQSQKMGLAYLPRVGIPIFFSSHSHNFHPVEQDANRRAFLYFNENVDGFYKTEDEMGAQRGWNFYSHPLNIDHSNERYQYVDYHNMLDLQLLNELSIHAKWYDYFCWLLFPVGPWGAGFFNTIYYNTTY